MFENISKMMKSEMPVASAAFYGAATLVAGRKFFVAMSYKACAMVAETFGRESAPEWNKASAESFSLAKKDAIRDLTAVVGCIGLLAVGLASAESLLEKEKSTMDNIKENPVYIGSMLTIATTMAYLCKRSLCGGSSEYKYKRSY